MEAKMTEHPLTDLIRELRDETATLVRQEIALAKAEITEKSSRMAKHAISIAAGVALAYAALVLLLLAIRDFLFSGMVSAGMSPGVAVWVSPLIVAIVVGIVGWILISQGKKRLAKEGIAPEKTVETLREEKDWLKHKIAHS